MNKKTRLLLLAVLGIGIGLGAYFIFFNRSQQGSRSIKLAAFLKGPEAHAEWAIKAGTRCGDAPFLFPTDGMIGYLWGDHFRIGHTHQGVDIFSGTAAGLTPVYSAYAGYLSRSEDWISTVIIRVPSDPLLPERQIWIYYTHLADQKGDSFIVDQFPPGTTNVFIPAGTLVGFQGDYSGDSGNPVWVHLHISIVKDDGNGNYLNELRVENTLDPTPYFGLSLNNAINQARVILCDREAGEKGK